MSDEVKIAAPMTPEEEQIRDIYAYFGVAVYNGQVLEYGIVNAMVILRLPNRDKFTKFDIDAFMDQQFENTLGKLIRNLRSETTLPTDLETILNKALKTRNWLCHSFFRERSDEFMTVQGRARMTDELQNAGDLLRHADKTLTATVQPLADRFGLTKEAIQAEIECMKRKLNS